MSDDHPFARVDGVLRGYAGLVGLRSEQSSGQSSEGE